MSQKIDSQPQIGQLEREGETSGRERFPVVIVGAGPVGMVLGLGLSRYGIKSVILDDDDKLSDGSRSICVQRHTLQIFERLGVVEPMLAKGVTWTTGRVFFGQKELFQIKFPGSDEKFPPFINLQQHYVEQFLVEGLARQTNCELRWLHKVVGLNQSTEKVEVMVETPDSRKVIEAEYVLAADGARSTVRQLLGLEFLGKTYHDRFLIADVRAKLNFPNERWFWFDPTFNRGKSALLHPQPDGVWRIDWQLGPHVDIEAASQPQALDKRIREVIGELPYEIVWQSIYTFHQRHAAQFRKGRVFLAGDAAHIMSPFGARGMNSGVQDANNLIWKLWLVWQSHASDSLLDSYDTERHAAALENLHITDGSMAFITPHTRPRLWRRNLILRSSVRFKRLRKLVNSGRLSQPCHYQYSPLLDKRLHLPPFGRLFRSATLLKSAYKFRRGPRSGWVAPDAVYTHKGQKARLIDVIGHEFVLLYFSEAPEVAALQLETALQNLADLPLKAYIVTNQPVGERIIREQVVGEHSVAQYPLEFLDDSVGEISKTYAAASGTLYLVRPDGHIAARGLQFPLSELAKVLQTAVKGSNLHSWLPTSAKNK